jgi:acyl carrier protein
MLIKYRNENPQEIEQIANWYKENFFVEPTEDKIVKAFELEGYRCDSISMLCKEHGKFRF